MQSILKLKSLTKNYGRDRGVTNLNLEVAGGSIVGFLGPNGAGKTTTMNMLMSFTNPSSGTATIFGRNTATRDPQIRAGIGFLASDFALDGALTGRQQLQYFAHLRGKFDANIASNIEKLSRRLDIDIDKKIKKLSRGNHQKIALIAALAHKPKLLILDEPTSGLDPLVQAEFNKIIAEHRAAGGTAFISSHVLSEVQELCDRLVFIREGRIVDDTTLAKLTTKAPRRITIAGPNLNMLAPKITTLRGVVKLRKTASQVEFDFNGDLNQMLKLLSMQKLTDITIEKTNLEAAFMQYYEGENTASATRTGKTATKATGTPKGGRRA